MAISRLIERLINWLRTIGHSPEPTPPGIKTASTPDATLWKLNSREPGVVAAYWVVHRDAARDLAIALINIAVLREDLARNDPRSGSDPLRITSRSTFRAELNRYLAEDNQINLTAITHIFVVTWQGRQPDERHRYPVAPICAIPCDLQGLTFAWTAGDRYASNITEAMAKQLLRLRTRQGESWEFFVSRINWVGWLDSYAKMRFGPNHVLQPRKS